MTKTVLIDSDGRILWRFYDLNGSNSVALAVCVLQSLCASLPSEGTIAQGCDWPCGGLFRAILGVDAGEVETNAYYHAVNFFLPSANFLFDLGGQDMKCIRMRDGA
jgi:activator of 2-hydroxyglutaryl-CoA dehydratase